MYITAANPEKKRNCGTHFLSRLQEAVRQVSSNTDPVTPALPSLLLHGQGLGFCLSLVTPAPSSTNPLKCGLDDVTDHSFFFPPFLWFTAVFQGNDQKLSKGAWNFQNKLSSISSFQLLHTHYTSGLQNSYLFSQYGKLWFLCVFPHSLPLPSMSPPLGPRVLHTQLLWTPLRSGSRLHLVLQVASSKLLENNLPFSDNRVAAFYHRDPFMYFPG